MDEDEFEQMRSPMYDVSNGWSLDLPGPAVRGFFWVIEPEFPEDPNLVHVFGGFVRHFGASDSVMLSDFSAAGVLWNGPIAVPKPPEADRNATVPSVVDPSLVDWITRARAMTEISRQPQPFAGTDLE